MMRMASVLCLMEGRGVGSIGAWGLQLRDPKIHQVYRVRAAHGHWETGGALRAGPSHFTCRARGT